MKIFNLYGGLILLLLLPALTAFAKEDDHTVQTIIHLLDYISGDYPAAVQKHAIQNQEEYREMLEFSATVTRMCGELATEKHIQKASFLDSAKRLNRIIKKRYSPESISLLSKSIKDLVIKATGYEVSPAYWPESVCRPGSLYPKMFFLPWQLGSGKRTSCPVT